jgi:hypothetical protein
MERALKLNRVSMHKFLTERYENLMLTGFPKSWKIPGRAKHFL